MAYVLDIIVKKNYLHISASGTQTLDDNIKLASDCLETCKKYAMNRLLIDIRGLSGQLSVIADYELAKLVTAWEPAGRISLVAVLDNESNLRSGRFFETTMRNRGINLYVFFSLSKAEEWINT